jgi:hypothetical protein
VHYVDDKVRGLLNGGGKSLHGKGPGVCRILSNRRNLPIDGRREPIASSLGRRKNNDCSASCRFLNAFNGNDGLAKGQELPAERRKRAGELFRVGFEAREIVNLDFSYKVGGFGGGIFRSAGHNEVLSSDGKFKHFHLVRFKEVFDEGREDI